MADKSLYIKPPHVVRAFDWTRHNPSTRAEIDAFFATWWQTPDGEKALVLTNFRPVEQTVFVDGKPVALPPLNAVIVL